MNDFVDVVESHEIALEDVGTSLRLLEVEAGATGHHVDLVVDIVLQHLAKRQELGHAIHECQVDHAEGGLELGELIQVVEDDLRDDVLLELDDETNALLVRLVAEVRDALESLLVDELGDLLLEGALVDLVGHLGKDEAGAAGLRRLDVGLGANGQRAATGLIGIANAIGAHDLGACREVRAGHDRHELIGRRVRVIDEHARGLDGLTEVVRRNVGRHANRDAVAAVDQEVRETGRQDGGLGERLVIVGLPIDRILLEITEELHGGFGEAALRVTHSGRGVTVDVAEVTMTVNERGAHAEPLGQADHRVINSGVTVRVVLADNFADRPRTLLVRAVGEDTALVHRVEDAAVDRLQTIANVRQSTSGNDRHRVLDEGLAHLMTKLADLERSAVLVHLARVGSAASGAKLLLELAVILLLGLVVRLNVDVGAVILGRGAIKQALEVVGQVRPSLVVGVVIVCHFWPFS